MLLVNLRSSALNDAKNNAYHAVGSDKRIMLKVIFEKGTCVYNGNVYNCTKEQIGQVRSYVLKAQIFDCGSR